MTYIHVITANERSADKELERLRDAIRTADAVLIGAGCILGTPGKEGDSVRTEGHTGDLCRRQDC